jgi:hypothetical protein
MISEMPVARLPMLKKILIPAIVCLAVPLLLVTFRAGQAQQDTAVYFPETGHYVDEPFLPYFQAQGGARTWGSPITEAFEENGQLVQYFERSRMECPAEGQSPCEPRLSAVGELLGHQSPRVPPVPDSMIKDGLCRYFPETGHNVCFSFLTYYLDKGGPETLGPPISELVVQPGVVCQYFSRASLEWHTDRPASAAMQLGALGRELFVAKGLDASLLAGAESPGETPAVSPGISVGGLVSVVNTEGAGLRLRSGPGLGYSTVETAHDGEVLRVVAGPESADGFTWWQLDRDGTVGWCATDWLTPIDSSSSP